MTRRPPRRPLAVVSLPREAHSLLLLVCAGYSGLVDAVRWGLVGEEVVDRAADRAIRARIRVGDLGG